MIIPIHRQIAAHVLAIDNDGSILSSYRSMLEERPPSLLERFLGETGAPQRWSHYFRVTCATSGEAGVHVARQALAEGDPVAVVLIDMRLGEGWDGLSTARELLAVDHLCHVIFVTAHSDYDAAGIWNGLPPTLRHRILLIKKPFDHDVLRIAVASQAERTARDRALAVLMPHDGPVASIVQIHLGKTK